MKDSSNKPEICPWHVEDNLSYSATCEDAEERLSKGQEQIKCLDCKLWIWPDLFGTKPVIKTTH